MQHCSAAVSPVAPTLRSHPHLMKPAEYPSMRNSGSSTKNTSPSPTRHHFADVGRARAARAPDVHPGAVLRVRTSGRPPYFEHLSVRARTKCAPRLLDPLFAVEAPGRCERCPGHDLGADLVEEEASDEVLSGGDGELLSLASAVDASSPRGSGARISRGSP